MERLLSTVAIACTIVSTLAYSAEKNKELRLENFLSEPDYSELYQKGEKLAECVRYSSLIGWSEKAEIFAKLSQHFYLSAKKTENETLKLILMSGHIASAKTEGYKLGQSAAFKKLIDSENISKEEKELKTQVWERTNELWVAAMEMYKANDCDSALKTAEASLQ